MVTRRSTHANHARPSTAPKRRANRRAAANGKTLYAGGKTGARGGHVGNVAGLGGGGASGERGGAPSIGNVAGLGGGVDVRAGGAHRRTTAAQPSRPSRAKTRANRSGASDDGQALLTRRRFLYGALGVGALAAIGGGGAVVVQQMQSNANDELDVLQVPASAVTASDSLTRIEDAGTRVGLTATCELPYGSLVWASDENVAACLLPTEGASPLTHVALLSLGSGQYTTVLEGAVGLDEGFEIYDVRATSEGLVWTEADILDGIWRIYTARVEGAGTGIGAPVLADEGGADYETPSIAAAGGHAFWQVLPKSGGNRASEDSVLKRVRLGSTGAETVCSSTGRMATPPYALDDAVIVTPRTDTASVHYQLTRIDAESGSVTDTMVLPSSMKPIEAGYGETGFSFAFDAIYNYGDGIANLGTYTPSSAVTDGNYSAAPWFCFGRTPTAAPAWCGKYFMVKSTTSVCGVDLESGEYFTLDPDSGADDYGEYLASTGSRGTVVTFANIDHAPLGEEAVKCCRVRIWEPLA